MSKQALTIAMLIPLLQGMQNQDDLVTLYNPEDGSFKPITFEDVQSIKGMQLEDVIAKNVLQTHEGQAQDIVILCLNSNAIDGEEVNLEDVEGDSSIKDDVIFFMESMDGLSTVIHDLQPTMDGHTVKCAPGLAAFSKAKAEVIHNIATAQRGMYSLLEVIAQDKNNEDEHNAMVAQHQGNGDGAGEIRKA